MIVVGSLSIAPVKGLGLQHPASIGLTERGVLEDRRFYLIDETGRLIDGLVAGPLVQVDAWTDPDGSMLRLTMPDGQVVEGDVRIDGPVVTDMHGRIVNGHVVEGPWAAAISAVSGRDVRVVRVDEPGGTRTGHQASLVTDGSLRRLARQLGEGSIDGRRFRLLIGLDGGSEHEEDTWIDGRVSIGEAILRISGPIPRCAITTQDPDSGVRDLDTLRAIRDYRGLRDGKHLDFGVYGEIERPGTVSIGDQLRVL